MREKFHWTNTNSEKLNPSLDDLDNLTPLDARNSLLMTPTPYLYEKDPMHAPSSTDGFLSDPANSHSGAELFRPITPRKYIPRGMGSEESTENLIINAVPIGGVLPHERNPTGYDTAYRGAQF